MRERIEIKRNALEGIMAGFHLSLAPNATRTRMKRRDIEEFSFENNGSVVSTLISY